MSFHFGRGDNVQVRIQERRNNPNRSGAVALTKHVAVLPRLLVQVNKLDIVFFLQRQIAVILESLKSASSGDRGFPDDNLFL